MTAQPLRTGLRPPGVALALLTGFLSLPASGAEGLLHLACHWQRSTDMETFRSTPHKGRTDFYYDPVTDLTGTMKKDGFSHSFVAGTRDRLIEGVAHYQAGGKPAEQRVQINRYTGAIRNLIRTASGATLLEGTCTRISGPAFGKEPGQ